MALKNPVYTEFDLNATSGYSKIISLTHTDDDNVDVIELCVKQSGAPTDLTGSTAIARMVLHGSPDVLISDNVACTINDAGNILIPFDNASIESRKGIVKIEVNVTREPDILTLQLPLWVKINGSILESATIDPHSEGTIPELLKAAQKALDDAAAALEDAGDYSKLDNKPQINGHTLSGNKTSSELGLQDKLTAGDNVTIDENGVISAEGGGSQIVSGVVNQNGTITFTNSDGTTFTTSGTSVIGADGFSPTATVTQTASGATVTITDKNGTTTANISNGNDYVLTAQDKSDIADIVLSELPTTTGVLYGNTSN